MRVKNMVARNVLAELLFKFAFSAVGGVVLMTTLCAVSGVPLRLESVVGVVFGALIVSMVLGLKGWPNHE